MNEKINDIFKSSQLFYTVPTCCICLEDLDKELCVTNCGHVYHEKCLSQSMETNKRCPLCKQTQQPLHTISRLHFDVKSLSQKEIDVIKYKMQQWLDSISSDEQKQFIKLLEEKEQLTKLNTKLTQENRDLKDSSIAQKDEINSLQNEKNNLTQIADKQKRKKKYYKSQTMQQELDNKNLTTNYNNATQRLDQVEKELKELQQFKALKQQLDQEDKNQLKYWEEIKQQPIEQQLIIVQQALFIKKGQNKSMQEQFDFTTEENIQLKKQLSETKRQIKSLQEEKAIMKQKQDKLKELHQKLFERYRSLKVQTKSLAQQQGYSDLANINNNNNVCDGDDDDVGSSNNKMNSKECITNNYNNNIYNNNTTNNNTIKNSDDGNHLMEIQDQHQEIDNSFNSDNNEFKNSSNNLFRAIDDKIRREETQQQKASLQSGTAVYTHSIEKVNSEDSNKVDSNKIKQGPISIFKSIQSNIFQIPTQKSVQSLRRPMFQDNSELNNQKFDITKFKFQQKVPAMHPHQSKITQFIQTKQ